MPGTKYKTLEEIGYIPPSERKSCDMCNNCSLRSSTSKRSIRATEFYCTLTNQTIDYDGLCNEFDEETYD